MLNSIVASIRAIEERNRELEDRNAELSAALRQANERITDFEQATEASFEPEGSVLATVQVIESNREPAEPTRKTIRESDVDRYEMEYRQVVQLQREAISHAKHEAAPEPANQSIDLVASPFGTFSTIVAFHKALRQLRDVANIKATAFEGNTMHFTVWHSGSLPLIGSLMEVDEFSLQLVSFTPDRIEIRITSN